jgi:hypothetical protein
MKGAIWLEATNSEIRDDRSMIEVIAWFPWEA